MRRVVAVMLLALIGQMSVPPAMAADALTSAQKDEVKKLVREYLLEWRAWWEKNRVHASALLEAGFAWLERNVPEDIERIVTVHGDARPDNGLVVGGRLGTMLDWEFAHPGDPAEDLLYALGFVQEGLSAEEFLAEYRAAGGAPISDGGADRKSTRLNSSHT